MAKKNGKTILVTGATGKQGGAVMRRLQEKNFTLRAMMNVPRARRADPLDGTPCDVRFVGGIEQTVSQRRQFAIDDKSCPCVAHGTE